MTKIVFTKTPKCSTPEQFREWVRAARMAKPGYAGFCTDCTPAYARLMRKDGRCEHPEVRFRSNGDGFAPSV